MTDNTTLPGTGDVIADEDIAGVKHQLVKLEWGASGTANKVDTATGKPLPVQVRSATGLIPIGEPTDAAATATDTTSVTGISIWKQISASIQILAGAVSSSKVATKSAAADFADGAITTLGLKADAKSAATDITSITLMSVAKQISASIQAAAASLAGTLTVAAHAVTNAGTFAVQVSNGNSNGQAAMIGSTPVVVASDQTTLAVANDTSRIMNGAGGVSLTPKFAIITASSSGATTIVAAVTSKKIRVLQMVLTSNGAVNVKWQSHVTPTDKTGLFYEIANTGYTMPFSPVGWFETVAGEALDINLSAGVAVGGVLAYVEV